MNEVENQTVRVVETALTLSRRAFETSLRNRGSNSFTFFQPRHDPFAPLYFEIWPWIFCVIKAHTTHKDAQSETVHPQPITFNLTTTSTMEETFHQLPLTFDSSSKIVSSTDSTLQSDISALNALHKTLTSATSGLETSNGIPPPPSAVQPKRSAQIAKARDSGNVAQRAAKHDDAVRMYTLAIDIAAARPLWEPAPLAREELCALYSNRAQAYMGLKKWADGAVDAKTSVELKRVGNAKAWWRRGKCLVEMGRWDEAAEWVNEGMEFEGREVDLVELDKQIKERKNI
jgi:translocation protein SEC72